VHRPAPWLQVNPQKTFSLAACQNFHNAPTQTQTQTPRLWTRQKRLLHSLVFNLPSFKFPPQLRHMSGIMLLGSNSALSLSTSNTQSPHSRTNDGNRPRELQGRREKKRASTWACSSKLINIRETKISKVQFVKTWTPRSA
jgi:hypothetical protein